MSAWGVCPGVVLCISICASVLCAFFGAVCASVSGTPLQHSCLESSYDGDLSLPLGLALGSPIFPSGCEGKLGVALESLQGLRDLT